MRRRAVRVGTMRESHMRIGSAIVLIWLLIGVVACVQRDYFDSGPVNCAGFGTIVVTTIAGPLNYMGVNPKVEDCNVPQPSP
ncbi:hypothetical protein SAMN05421776_10396 [Nocardia farcinica]|uniref:Lipoprotein n=2 Tax=Nocardiaceae TaxID=85025 RepID=A0A0H5NZ19_NOCFR|nr:Uncharacterised protein [Nocardia farcinica]SIT07511.1 hypothetical protein SAMN05421776_10396 [Nocardia farcinica]SUE31291.1 Uncharacterised protein [Nocardia farcinica]VFA93597.1 Uncharacterised protein [Nocardia farcinica]